MEITGFRLDFSGLFWYDSNNWKEKDVMMTKNRAPGGMTELSLDEMEHITGGTDYSYVYGIMGDISGRFDKLIASGVPAEEARTRVKNEYMGQVRDLCARYPESCGAEMQTQAFFMSVLGSSRP